MNGSPEKVPRPGLALIKRFAAAALLIVALSATATATTGMLEIKDVADIIRTGGKIEGIENVLEEAEGSGPQTILVLGSDRRFGDTKGTPARSDTLMLVRLDPSKEATAVMSLPRDLRVAIPGYGFDRINAAYAFGGAKLSVQTVKALLKIPITHVVEVQFGGFQRAVNRLGCVYVDVDRRYFNDNNPPFQSAGKYATIDLKPGYQKLCGSDSLDYVRFRHLDDDYVRAARQQGFLRQAKDQFGLGTLFGSRKELLRIFAAYTRTDIRSEGAILKLLRLAWESSKHPIRTVHFATGQTPDRQYATVSDYALATARDEFLDARATQGPPPTKNRAGGSSSGGSSKTRSKSGSKSKKRKKTTGPPLAPGMIVDRRAAEDYVADAATRTHFPLYYPTRRLATSRYYSDRPRVYDIYDRGKHKYRAYRIVMPTGEIGQYYGIQGMSWKSPPILDNPSETVSMGGRKFDLFYDGGRLRLVALRTPKAVYWVSNTLSLGLTNKQMRDIARSLRRIGS